MKTKPSQVSSSNLDEALIARYLRRHPDFFARHEKLLANMIVPHQTGAVSLIERQVVLLREQQLATKKKLDKYVAAARINDAIFSKSRKLILALIETTQPEAFFAILEHIFRRDFKASAYRLMVFDDDMRKHNNLAYSIPESVVFGHIGAIMRSKKPTLGVLRPRAQNFLFGQQSGRVQSAMVLPIRADKTPIATLAIGSDNKGYFSSDMGTLFASFIAETLGLLLPRHLVWEQD